MDKQVGIIGAGISGLLACKHLLAKGFKPVVFEATSEIGGVWSHCTIRSTKLQTPKSHYQFSDFTWPSSVTETFPHHTQVRDYLNAYAAHFNLLPCIKFNTKVLRIGYVVNEGVGHRECDNNDDTEYDNVGYSSELSWETGKGEAFPRHAGKWNIIAQETCHPSSSTEEVYQVDFVILCSGKYSTHPYVPDFPINKGPEIFNGRTLHSLDYAALGDQALEHIKNKRITVVGFQKSAVDIVSEVARENGVRHPCTLLYKTAHWTVSESFLASSFQFLNRFAELMVHKPNEGYILGLLAFLLTPLLWIYSKSVETYLKWIYPLKKYKMVPEHSFFKQIVSCMFTVLPSDFYDMVREGSIILKKSQTLSFFREGLIVDGKEVPADMVIFATGCRSEEIIKGIFISRVFQKLIAGSLAPLYRECIHPSIPQLAILGYSDSASHLFSAEMRSKWLAHFLSRKLNLPSTREMEEEAIRWQKCMIRYAGDYRYKKSCVSVLLQIYSNDQLCKDMGCKHRRKRWFLPELFASYGPADYANIT